VSILGSTESRLTITMSFALPVGTFDGDSANEGKLTLRRKASCPRGAAKVDPMLQCD
jgi:hypothetical protein